MVEQPPRKRVLRLVLPLNSRASHANRSFLQPNELRRLDLLFLDAVRAIDALKADEPVGKHLQRPKLPSALSEGLVAAVCPALFGQAVQVQRPAAGRMDLEVVNLDPPSKRLVAVKGTGSARWVTLTSTDMAASCLVWLDYTERIATGTGPVDVWLFDRPLTRWARTGRLTFQQITDRYGAAPRNASISLDVCPAARRPGGGLPPAKL
jgi:hypothetical protein